MVGCSDCSNFQIGDLMEILRKRTDGEVGESESYRDYGDDIRCRGCLVRLRNEAQEGMMCGKTPQLGT